MTHGRLTRGEMDEEKEKKEDKRIIDENWSEVKEATIKEKSSCTRGGEVDEEKEEREEGSSMRNGWRWRGLP